MQNKKIIFMLFFILNIGVCANTIKGIGQVENKFVYKISGDFVVSLVTGSVVGECIVRKQDGLQCYDSFNKDIDNTQIFATIQNKIDKLKDKEIVSKQNKQLLSRNKELLDSNTRLKKENDTFKKTYSTSIEKVVQDNIKLIKANTKLTDDDIARKAKFKLIVKSYTDQITTIVAKNNALNIQVNNSNNTNTRLKNNIQSLEKKYKGK